MHAAIPRQSQLTAPGLRQEVFMASSIAALWYEETQSEFDGTRQTRCHHAMRATQSQVAAVQHILGHPEC